MEKYILTENYLLREIMNESVLIPQGEQILKNNVIIELNETAYFLYSKLSEALTEKELTGFLLEEYDTTEIQAAADVKSFIKKLTEADVVKIVNS